jgi:predicted nucleic acid-binding protein
VILLDANFHVYAHVASLPQHRFAASWLDAKLNADAIVALPWQSLLSFARLTTNPGGPGDRKWVCPLLE